MTPFDSRNWLDSIYRPLRGSVREVIAISLFVNLLSLALPIFILQVYDRVVMHNGLSTLYALSLGMIVIVIFDFLLRQTRSKILQWSAVRVDGKLAEKIYDKIMSLPLPVLEQRSTNDWLIMFRDVDIIRNTICGPTAVLAVDLPFAVLFIGVIYLIAQPIAWVLVVAVPCFLLLTWRSGRVLEEATQDERKAQIDRDALISEMLTSRETVKALALDKGFKSRWENSHAMGIERSLNRGKSGDKYMNMGTSLAAVTTVALTAFGALAIIDLAMTIGSLIAANMLSNRVISPLNQLVGSWRNYAHYKQSLSRLDELFGIIGDTDQGGVDFERPEGALALEGVSYGYSPLRPPVLSAINLSFKSGGLLAGIVGPNGSGKTTLLKVIHGLYHPSSGRVLLDGGDISQFSSRQLAEWMGYVSQEAQLFKGSIRDNIAITEPRCTDKDVIDAAKLAGVHEYIVDLPEGYETDVGERGSRLSGGERQRIAIARALLGDPPILLLDEPSSSLDAPAQRALIQTLTGLAKDHTVILVTHRPSLLAKCGYICVLEHGSISMAGPSGEILPRLLSKKPTIAAANRNQDKLDEADSGASKPENLAQDIKT